MLDWISPKLRGNQKNRKNDFW